MSQLKINLPAPHPAQNEVIADAKRFNVVCCGRRWGKSKLGENRIVPVALSGNPVAWFAPTYKILAEAWRDVKHVVGPAITKISEQEHRLELLNKGSIDMWSLDGDVVTRGRKYKLAVIDEAALVRDLLHIWDTAIRPTLVDLRGDAWFLSTPRGMNDFQKLFTRGQDPTRPTWASWQMPTSKNPYISQDEIDDAKRDITEAAFSQEFLAQFISWEGAVFRRILESATAEPRTGPEEGHIYVVGVDWGKTRDYTVFVVIDVTTKQVVYLERSNTVDYVIQRQRLGLVNTIWKPFKIIAEQNSIGIPIIEQLQREGLPIQPFVTTNASKAVAIEALALAFERGDIRIPDNPVLLGELQAFKSAPTPSGMIRYSAPDGQHDDTVMALAMGWYGIAEHRMFPEFNTNLHVINPLLM